MRPTRSRGLHRGSPGLVLALACLTGCAAGGGPAAPASTADAAAAHLELARGYLSGDDHVRARRPVLRALELDPQRVEAHVLAGVIYEREQDADLAERHFRAALALAPADSQALNNYGAFLYGQGRFREALRPLRRAAGNRGYRARAQAYENLGLAELALDRAGAARAAFQHALEFGGRQPRSALELARIHYARGDYAAAERYYHDFLAHAGETGRGLCLGLQLAGVQGATVRSVNHAQQLRDRFPGAIEACR